MRPVLCRVLAVCAVSVAVSLSFTEGAPLAVPLCMLRKCALIHLLRPCVAFIHSHACVPAPEAPKIPSPTTFTCLFHSRAVLWVACTASFLLLPVRYTPATYRCPASPWLPSLGVLACLHLIGSLGWPAYVRWAVWFTL